MLSLALLIATCVAPAPQVTRLNPRFELEDVVGGVQDYLLHPSGAEVVFRVDARKQRSFELYRAPLDGSRRPLPVVPMAPGRSVEHYAFSADGRWLVFTGDKDREGEVGLYSHRVGSVGSVRLDRGDADVTYGEKAPFLIVGNRVVYTTVGTGLAGGVYTVPIDGSAPVHALYEGRVLLLGASESAGRAYFYIEDYYTPGLFSALANGSGPLRFLSEGTPLSDGQPHDTLQLDPSGARAFFLRLRPSVFERELVTVPLDGSTPALVLASSLPYNDGRFFLSADGTRVVFERATGATRQIQGLAADGAGPLVTLGNSTPSTRLVGAHGDRAYFVQAAGTGIDLLSAPMDGSAAPRMLAPNSFTPSELRVSADGQWVLYRAYATGPLYTVRADGSAPPVLLESNAAAFELSPASDRVLYSANGSLWSAPIDGSTAAARLPGYAGAFGFTPGGEHALAISAVSGPFELYRVEPADLQRVRLSRELARGTFSDVQDFATSATAGAVFRADALRQGDIELYAAAADGSAAPVLLTGPGTVEGPVLTPDGRLAAYIRTPRSGGPEQAYAVPTDGSRAPIRLNATLAPSYNVTDVQVTADGTRATFLVGVDYGWGGPRPRDLWIAPLDGSAPALQLATSVTGYVLSPDSRAAVFYDDSSSLNHFRRVPLDGSESPLTLADYENHSFLPVMTFTPDGSRAVIVARPNNTYIFTAAMQGPADVRVLVVASFAGAPVVTAAGRMVFSATLAGDTQMTIHSLALDGSDPRRISSGTSWVGAFSVAPNGTDAVYTEQGQLFRAALDGSSAPVLLSGALPGASFAAFSPDGTRVVFASSAELFSVPFDGSAAPLRISRTGTGAYGASVKLPLFVTPDSRNALYAADHDAAGVFDLWLAPLDGSSPALRVSPPLAPPGVSDYRLAPDGAHGLYMAAERPGVVELFTVPFPDMPQDRHLLPR